VVTWRRIDPLLNGIITIRKQIKRDVLQQYRRICLDLRVLLGAIFIDCLARMFSVRLMRAAGSYEDERGQKPLQEPLQLHIIKSFVSRMNGG
jgi:hypothetical protein